MVIVVILLVRLVAAVVVAVALLLLGYAQATLHAFEKAIIIVFAGVIGCEKRLLSMRNFGHQRRQQQPPPQSRSSISSLYVDKVEI